MLKRIFLRVYGVCSVPKGIVLRVYGVCSVPKGIVLRVYGVCSVPKGIVPSRLRRSWFCSSGSPPE